MRGYAPLFRRLIRWTGLCVCILVTASVFNITVMAQARQYVTWSSITNGSDLGNGSVRKTSTGVWDFSSTCAQTLLPGDGFFESTAANYNQSISLSGVDGAQRALVIGTGGWAGIYENGVEVAATYGHIPSATFSAHAVGDRYRLEISNATIRYIRYRSAAREVLFASAGPVPAYPLSFYLGMSPQSAEWQKTVFAQLTRKSTWSSITSGIDLGGGSVRKTSTGVWDFSANSAQTLLRGDGYFESTASYYNQSINLSGTDGAVRAIVVGTGGWAAIYENGVEVAATSGHIPSETIAAHAAGDRYRLEISNSKLGYVRYRAGVRTLMFTSAASLPAYPLSFSLGASFQNSEWQNSVFAQISKTVSWSSITNGIDLGSGSVRKTSTGVWDFSAGVAQQLVYGSGYFESTASYYNQSINLGGTDGAGRAIVVGTGGWAGIYENGVEVAATYGHIPSETFGAHAAGDRYRLEISRGQLRYVRYRAGVRTLMFTSAAALPAYPLSFSLGASFQNSEWQNTIFSDNVPEHNDAAFVSQTVPATMVPGQSYSASLTMRNTGASTWTPDGDYQLASENLSDNQRWGLSRVNLTTTVAPGSDAIFNFNVTAPATPGAYSFQWRMVQQGVQRFGALTPNVNVTTVNGPPTVNLTSPTNNATFTAGSTVTLNATASDSDGTISKVEFFQGSVKLGEDTTAPYSFNWTNVPAGSYALTARATDNGGAIATSGTVNITVTTPNQPPSVSLSAPANGAIFAAPANITLTATAADTDGIVTKVQFFKGTTLLGEDLSAPFAYTWINVAAGSYSLTAKATDNAGATVTSAAVSIIVNTLPTVSVNSPTNGQVFTAPASFTITATAADADGSISKVEFFNGSSLLGEDLTTPYSFAWNYVPYGSYVLTARATDNRGGVTTSAAISTIVNSPPTSSITSPANNAAYT
ncbi:MAG: Ig-like domain-containing protein, partial [Pyrinomonadaceae bacterium]